MKIIQVSSYYPPHIGGGDFVVRALSENLAAHGHNVEVYTSDIGSESGKLPSIKNLKIHYLKSFEFAHASIIYSLFFKLMKITKDSVIHVHVGHVYVPEIVYLVSTIIKVPYVAHFHLETRPTGKFGFLLPFYKKYILRKVLQSATKIVVPTEDYISVVNKSYLVSKEKIVVIPNGIDPNVFKPTLSIKDNQIKNILFVGRLTSQKNVPLLIQSFKKIKKKNPKVKLNIVGDGEDRTEIEDLIKKEKLQNHVILYGALQGKNLVKVYHNSDIFILPSKYESFGIVLIEAMASGLPVIASNIPALRKVVNNNSTGLLVDLTVESIAIAINKLLNNTRLRKKLVKNSLEMVKGYNWDVIIPSFEKIYKEILQNN